MTNALVGEVYLKIIQDVIKESRPEFEENGVSQSTLVDLEKEWKTRLSGKNVALMPWDPRPEPPAQAVPQQQQPAQPMPSAAANGLPATYSGYGAQPVPNGMPNGAQRIKVEPQYGQPNQYIETAPPMEGGQVRAQQLAQAYAQQRGLALPGQRPTKVQQPQQQQYTQQQMYYMQQQRQQAALQQQQAQPRIKVENENSPQLVQGHFQQQQQQRPNYGQTDGSGDGIEEWQAYMAQRRAATAEQTQHADHMMRDRILQNSADLQSGLMVPLDQQPKRARNQQGLSRSNNDNVIAGPSMPQLDGGDEDEDEKKPLKAEEDDQDAINSDLDSDNDDPGDLNDDDDENGDSILCTYDKVQRVKNKWKCVLKDGVMSVNGKEWVFHKGTGEFEW